MGVASLQYFWFGTAPMMTPARYPAEHFRPEGSVAVVR